MSTVMPIIRYITPFSSKKAYYSWVTTPKIWLQILLHLLFIVGIMLFVHIRNRARNYKILLSAIWNHHVDLINLICGRPALDMMKYNDRPFHLCVPFFFSHWRYFKTQFWRLTLRHFKSPFWPTEVHFHEGQNFCSDLAYFNDDKKPCWTI